ncbi:SMI1/KNR4 family protein [Actinomadura rugatobispora]|uniref:SMI1/KNR4 family protein n=1 Tax=Actinomadura rugatobispora TaxID=1994 RepID=A0ABW1A861_9ACTN|nr:hypothetical protein GCM10010200_026610 [Actinomadura rugatobispora]
MNDAYPTVEGLREAGRRLAATLRGVPEGSREPRFPGGTFPADYVELLSRTGPGTLAGVLRLLTPGDGDGHLPPHEDALLWGVFAGGETCWWLPFGDDPGRWLVALNGHGHQQLNLTTTEFLDEWLDGRLDLPVLSLPPVPRERTFTPPGHPVTAPPAGETARDSLAQLRTIVGPGTPATFDWEAAERRLGVPGLPSDYKRLYEEYGGHGHWIVFNGIFIETPQGIAAEHPDQADILRDDLDVLPSAAPGRRYTLHPEPGGLLYCGSTEGRDTLFWDTHDADPDRWPVVNAGYGEAQKFGPLVELLVAELTGVGLGMTNSSLGDPYGSAWPFYGPRLRRT